MNILVIGGTRFMGKHLVNELILKGHQVTIATRGNAVDEFGDKICRLLIDRTNEKEIKDTLSQTFYDVVYDSLAYCSNDINILLAHISCGKYITISTTAVYKLQIDTKEEAFNPLTKKLVWCDRTDFPYAEIKRQAECALFQTYKEQKAVAVRFPFVLGEDDYTKRLYFYVEHILKQEPIYVDNVDEKMSFVRSDEAGKFLAFFADKDVTGVMNGASDGNISVKEIAQYVFEKTNKKMILSKDGAPAPYNGVAEYSINTDLAKRLGYHFTPLKEWIYSLIDIYIAEIVSNPQLLLSNLERLHTTVMGKERILKNLRLNTEDAVTWCKEQIKSPKSKISRRGKNWYIVINDCEITVNAHSYTIITAHILS